MSKNIELSKVKSECKDIAELLTKEAYFYNIESTNALLQHVKIFCDIQLSKF